jgi:3-hydroxyisobutyrate dehydrogenase-like beta-hydroxyacid dehydrogenase
MCKNLVEKGNLDKPLILYNRTKKRSDDLAAALGTDKTKVVDSIDDAVKSADIIFMCLGDDAAVNSTVDVILEQQVEGKLIVDASTVHPDTTNALEKRVTAKGAGFVGMPGPSPRLLPLLTLTIKSIRCPRNGRSRLPRLRPRRRQHLSLKSKALY